MNISKDILELFFFVFVKIKTESNYRDFHLSFLLYLYP